MEKLTFEEILKTLEQKEIYTEELGREEYDEDELGLGEIKEVHSKGGGEGGGDTVERVLHFVEHDVYISFGGYYSSYEGTEWDSEITEVKPKQVEVTIYE